jgi:hypothetical protein
MTQVMEPIFSIDADAVRAGGRKAGAMLDRINKTNLGELTEDEWQEFCGILVMATLDAALHGLILRLEREPLSIEETFNADRRQP